MEVMQVGIAEFVVVTEPFVLGVVTVEAEAEAEAQVESVGVDDMRVAADAAVYPIEPGCD